MSTRRRKGAALQVIPEEGMTDSVLSHGGTVPAQVLRIIEELEDQVNLRIASIMSAAEGAVLSLKNELKAKLVRLPKAVREMPLKEFQDKFPDDFKTGALQEIRERYAAMAVAAQNSVPATAARGVRTAKRGAEPESVLRTVRPRRAGPIAPPPKWGETPAAPLTTRRGARAELATVKEEEAEPSQPAAAAAVAAAGPIAESRGGASAGPSLSSFNGRPLQTPMPFVGAATAVPVTMLTQKRGGRTKAAPVPDAAVITTSDGMQWALGKGGMGAIPETHRAEVTELLSAQFEFLAAALGKTVFQRQGGRGGRRG